MGLLIEGVWKDQWYDTKSSNGEFIRQESQFRNWITKSGEPGPTGKGGFKAEKGRYHLYVSLACPWAHRTLIFLKLKQLESIIPYSVVAPHMLDKGWTYQGEESTGDPVNHVQYHYELYTKAMPGYTGRVTVPVLWDKESDTIVNNESAEIIRIFNSAFDHLTNNQNDYCPRQYRAEIDRINELVYNNVNNGVYRCGFATTQKAYEDAFKRLFDTMEQLEEILSAKRYLIGDWITEADWRLFTTLIRFDAVYYGHFKTNFRRLVDYPNLFNYTKELYQISGVKDTVNFHHIKEHYYYSHDTINPTRIVPVGPELDFLEKHDRDRIQ